MATGPSCYLKAVELLARRPHFARELAVKLARRRFPPEEIRETLERLEREGYLDDRRAAVELAASRLARGPVGVRRLRAELKRRGAPAEAIEEALEGRGNAAELAAAREAARRWRRGGRREGAALARHLDRKGFARGAILTVLEEEGLRSAGADDGAGGDENGG